MQSLALQEYRNLEVIIVDQSSREGAGLNQSAVESFVGSLPIRYHRCSTKGLSRARNEGLAFIGDARLVAFRDDDCWYDPLLLRRVVEAFNADSGLGVLVGQYAEPERGRYPRFPQERRMLTPATAFGSSVGLFFAADVFTKARIRFDERIGVGTELPAAEELDVILHALFKGYKASYDPTIVVYHPIKQLSTTDTIVQAREAAHSYVFGKYMGAGDAAYVARVARRSLKILIDALGSKQGRLRLSGMLQGYRLAFQERAGR